jgi:hypothetical protein
MQNALLVIVMIVVIFAIILWVTDKYFGILGNKDGKKTLEFQLVIFLIVAFIIFTLMILVIPLVYIDMANIAANATESFAYRQAVMDYQQEIFTVVVAAFSAWIGAGAAYFFGRENMNIATEKMLQMRGLSPKEKLQRKSIVDLKPNAIDWTVMRTTKLKEVFDRLKAEPMRWFITVVKDKKLECLIDEEGLYQFMLKNTADPPSNSLDQTVDDLIKYYNAMPDTEPSKKKALDFSIQVDDTDNVQTVEELMAKNHVHLAIVTDKEGKPISYITAGDIKRCLMSEEQG